MLLIKVIRLGQPVVEYPATEGQTFAEFLAANGVDATGRTLTFNSEAVSGDTQITANGQLLLAGATKGGC
jgi:hypothetical protein